MSRKGDGSVSISTSLDNSQIPRDARVMAAKLTAEFFAAGESAGAALQKAWEQVKLEYPDIPGTPEELAAGTLDMELPEMQQEPLDVHLDDVDIPREARVMAAKLAHEYFKAGEDAGAAFTKAWDEVKLKYPELTGKPAIPDEADAHGDIPKGQNASTEAEQAAQAALEAAEAAQAVHAATEQVVQDTQNVAAAVESTGQAAASAAENAAQGAQQAAQGAAQGAAAASEAVEGAGQAAAEGAEKAAQGVKEATSELEQQHAKIQQILADTEKTSSAKAMAIAQIYRQQGMSMSRALKEAWKTVKGYSGKASVQVGNQIRNNMGEAVTEVTGRLGGLKGVLGGLVPAITAAFSVTAVIQFGKKASSAARELSDAMVGLKSIMDSMGRSFSSAQSFIEEYTEDGLVPAANAVAAYKNLAMRGYDDSQIRKVMTALKDASAYGRAANLSMGDAVQSATEGLKNENSILVDNAGVTKNVAKMWEDYAKSIGTTAANLTQEQKIQAEVNGILEETKHQTGDAAKVAGTLSGQLQQTSFRLNELMVAVGNIINPILQAFLPAFNAAISVLTRFANTVAAVVGLVFGGAESAGSAGQVAAEGYDSAAESAEDFGDAATAAGKAAQKSLAGFDQITKLSDSSGSGGGGGSSNVAQSLQKEELSVSVAPLEDTLTKQLEQMLKSVKQKLKEFTALFEPSTAAWRDAFQSLAPVFEDVGNRIGSAWTGLVENHFKPLGKYLLNDFIPSVTNKFSNTFAPIFTDVMATAARVFALDFENATKVVGECCTWLQEGFDRVKMIFDGMCDGISKAWEKHGSGLMAGFEEFRAGLWDIWWKIYDSIIQPVMAKCAQVFDGLWKEHLKPLWDRIVSLALSIGDNLLALWNRTLKPIIDWIIAFLAPNFRAAFNSIADGVKLAIGFIADTIENLLQQFDGMITFITGVLTLDWQRAWSGIKDFFEATFQQIGNVLKTAVNSCIWLLNHFISGIYSGIRGVVNGLGSLAKSAGKIVGKNWGFSMPEDPPSIPYLAKGAVLPPNKPFLAMVGDQRNGTNVEAPLSTIQEAVAIVMEDMVESNMAGHNATVAALEALLDAVRDIRLGDDDIAAAVRRSQTRRAVMRGGAYAL